MNERSGQKGQAVMAVIMAVMIAGGLVLWVKTGRFHMMPMGGGPMEKGGGHTEHLEKDARPSSGAPTDPDTTGIAHGAHGDGEDRSAPDAATEHRGEDRENDSLDDEP